MISEQDLLDLIEGRLPRERVAAMRAALESDPALLRRVQGMVRDRQVLSSLDLGARAPAGVVGAAMRRATEERLSGRAPVMAEDGTWTEETEGPWWSRHRAMLVLAVAALMVITTIGLVTMAMLPRAERIESVASSMEPHRPENMGDEEWNAFLKRQQEKADRGEVTPVEAPPRPAPDLTEFIDDPEQLRLATEKPEPVLTAEPRPDLMGPVAGAADLLADNDDATPRTDVVASDTTAP
ncbi:MAG: hypothetical protein KDA21_14915, partial [Phycisphaerales bacterium]|nr:hypothetical protein [Phycisphaerales bacterium]